MNVGVCRVVLRMPQNDSLKGKRQLIRSLTARLRNKYNVSVAEVADNDRWQIVSLGITCVANSERHANDVLNTVVDFIVHSRLDAELLDYEIEMLTAL
jgi:hypothetical protein